MSIVDLPNGFPVRLWIRLTINDARGQARLRASLPFGSTNRCAQPTTLRRGCASTTLAVIVRSTRFLAALDQPGFQQGGSDFFRPIQAPIVMHRQPTRGGSLIKQQVLVR